MPAGFMREKCSRYWDGVTLNRLKKARLSRSALPKPQASAILSRDGSPAVINSLARSSLKVSRYLLGVVPVVVLNTRAKFLGLMAAYSAIFSTETG